MNDAEKAYQYFVIAVPENEEQAKAYFWARKALQPALTAPNEWVSVEDAMPPEHEPVLCIVDGKPKPNITLEDAYQIGSWNKADGWIIDEYLDWEDADVSWWMPLPAPPDRRPPEGDCEIKACAETCDECGFCDNTLVSPPEGEEDTK